jgi:molybdopterin-binding protein
LGRIFRTPSFEDQSQDTLTPALSQREREFFKENAMLSARNQFKGTIKEIKVGNVMAEVVVTVGNLEIASAITKASVERLGLKQGDTVTAVIKSTDVMIDK